MEPGERTGTTVTYWASPDIFETTTYSLETITSRIREYAFLNKGLEIVVRDERPQADEIAEAVEEDTAADKVDSVRPDDLKRGEGGGIEQVFRYDRGLVDFPALIDGREVYLCWELGEDDVGYWHDMDAGYGGREPLG